MATQHLLKHQIEISMYVEMSMYVEHENYW